MQNLDYTMYATENYERYEQDVYGRGGQSVYDLLENGVVAPDDILWYQAYEGFSFLSQSSNKNEQLAAELRRYIVIHLDYT